MPQPPARLRSPPRPPGRRRGALRRGLTLIEIMVVIAVMGLIALIAVPALGGLMDLQQRSAVKELATTYTWLLDEAALRNVTFRVAMDVDRGTWKVEVGEPGSVVFASPEEREEHDEELRDKMSRYTKRELEEGAAEELEGLTGRFEGLSDPSFETEQQLPRGTRFAWVWTPQYGDDGVEPNPKLLAGEEELDEEAETTMAYSYVFDDGTAELTVIRIVDEDDPEDGWTLVVEPLSGRVRLEPDLVDPKEALAWLPEEGPSIR